MESRRVKCFVHTVKYLCNHGRNVHVPITIVDVYDVVSHVCNKINPYLQVCKHASVYLVCVRSIFSKFSSANLCGINMPVFML